MPGFATGVAVYGKSEVIGRVNQTGPLDFFVQNKGDYDAVMSFLRAGDSGASAGVLLTDRDTKYTQLISDEESLEHTPVIPRTVMLTATGKPTLYDRDGDGVLRIARTVGALLAGGGGFLGVGGGTTSAAATKTLTVAGETFTTKGVRVGDKLIITDGLDKGVYTVTVRNSQTVVTVDRAWPTGGQSNVGYAIYAEDLNCGRVNYATGLVHVAYPSGDAPSAKARVKGLALFPVSLDPGMTLIVATDHAGGGTVTWDAVAAIRTSSAATFAALAGETFKCKIGSGPTETITMSTEANPVDAVAAINGQLSRGLCARKTSSATPGNTSCTGTFPVNLAPGDTLLVQIDGGGAQTATFNGTAGTILGSVDAIAAMAGETMEISIDGSAPVVVTFGAEATITAIVAVIQAALVALGATVTTESKVRASVSNAPTTFPVNLAAGDTLLMKVDGGAEKTATWDAAAAVYTGAANTFATLAGETFKVAINGGPELLIRMVAEANITDAMATINAELGSLATCAIATQANATIINSNPFPIGLAAGNTLTGKVNGGGVKTATWDAAIASLLGAGGTGFAALAGETFDITVTTPAGADGPHTITMGVEASQADAIIAINNQLTAAFGAGIVTCVSHDASNVDLNSVGQGLGFTVQVNSVSNVTLTNKLGIAAGSATGTGDVQDITAVSFAEFKAVIEADWVTAVPADLILATADGANARLTSVPAIPTGSDSSIEITGGTGAAALGFAVAVTLGKDTLKITTTKQGTGARVVTSAVAAGITTKLGISAGDVSGTGDVADIDAVSFNEFKTRVEADIMTAAPGDLVTVTADGASAKLNGVVADGSDSSIEITGGTGRVALGYALAVTIGTERIRITSGHPGSSSDVTLTNVAAGITTKLGLSAASNTGTGNVANIDAVLFAEFKSVVEAAVVGSLVESVAGDHAKISSNTANKGYYATVQVTGGNVQTALSFSAGLKRGQEVYTITSDTYGTGSTVVLSNVAAGITTKLGFSAGTSTGSGDVVDIDNVTYAEFASRVTADTTATVLPNEEDGSPVLISNTGYGGASSTIQVTGGTAQGVLGFDGISHAGTDADAELGVSVGYYASTLVPAGQTMSFRMVNLPEEEIIVGAAGIGGSSLLHVTYMPEPSAIP